MSRAHWKGKTFSRRHRLNLSKAKLGKKKSTTTKQKIRQAMKARVERGLPGGWPHNAVGVSHTRILAETTALEKDGYRCVPITNVIPDIIAIKDGKVIAIEIEYNTPNLAKYNKGNYKARFDEVRWLLRGKALHLSELKL